MERQEMDHEHLEDLRFRGTSLWGRSLWQLQVALLVLVVAHVAARVST